MNLKSRIRTIPNYPKNGIMYRDITTLLSDHKAFTKAIDLMADRYVGVQIDKIAAIEARGFIFGAPIAHKLKTALVPIRKKGKLPCQSLSASYNLEYGEDSLEIHEDALSPGDSVLIVDDLIATGGTLGACSELVGKMNAKVVGATVLIDLVGIRDKDRFSDININSLIRY